MTVYRNATDRNLLIAVRVFVWNYSVETVNRRQKRDLVVNAIYTKIITET